MNPSITLSCCMKISNDTTASIDFLLDFVLQQFRKSLGLKFDMKFFL